MLRLHDWTHSGREFVGVDLDLQAGRIVALVGVEGLAELAELAELAGKDRDLAGATAFVSARPPG